MITKIINGNEQQVATGSGENKVKSITAGTGLNGGTITDTGTISVKYGNGAGTSCEGNDSRLSDARTPTAHNQAASTITAGALGGKVTANATAVATLGDAQVRNIYVGTTELTPGVDTLASGDIYLQYEVAQ